MQNEAQKPLRLFSGSRVGCEIRAHPGTTVAVALATGAWGEATGALCAVLSCDQEEMRPTEMKRRPPECPTALFCLV